MRTWRAVHCRPGERAVSTDDRSGAGEVQVTRDRRTTSARLLVPRARLTPPRVRMREVPTPQGASALATATAWSHRRDCRSGGVLAVGRVLGDVGVARPPT